MEEEAGPPPAVILRDETNVTEGAAVQRKLIGAARAFSDLLKATLGPRGLDKMLYKTDGTTAVTNDGAKVVAELMVKHPAAKAFQSLASAQESACGDGVTSTLLFCGELLVESERLLRLGLHPSIVVDGYRDALRAAMTEAEGMVRPLTAEPGTSLLDVARTALSGRAASSAHDLCASLVSDALAAVVQSERRAGGAPAAEDVMMHLAGRGSLSESRLVHGVVLRRRIAMDSMPTSLQDAKVAVIGSDLQPRTPTHDTEIEVTDADVLTDFVEAEAHLRRDLAATILKSGATVVLHAGETDRDVLHHLVDEGCLVVGELDDSELRNVAAATGARMVGSPNVIESSDLGWAGRVDTRTRPATERVEDEIEISRCRNPGVVTIVVHGAGETTAEEIVRGLYDALRATALAIEDESLLAGGGATHARLALAVRKAAEKKAGRERLAMEGFARALEIVPAVLMENAGGDPLDGILELRSAISEGDESIGIDSSGLIGPVTGVVHPATSLVHGIDAATEAACGLLRIDQVISARGD